MPSFNRLQSAMEYLMTYGWAILVIAVVLGVLYSLGIFSPSNFAPKAQPGSCQVFRPNGPETTFNLNLEGTCSEELPEYAGFFNGQTSYLTIPDFSSINPDSSSNSKSIIFWIYLTGYPSNDVDNNFILFTPSNNGPALRVAYVLESSGVVYDSNGCNGEWTQTGTRSSLQLNKWIQVAVVRQNSTISIYYNATSQSIYGNPMGNICSGSSSYFIGKPEVNGAPSWPPYYISNIQIYDSPMSQNDVTALYQEGIGGSPIHLQNLTAWWPLNGDVNDYSGNNNNGVPTSVRFTGTWQNGYTSP